MSAAGDIDRTISDAEAKTAGVAVAAFIRALGKQDRSLATYALSVIVTFMAKGTDDEAAAEKEIIAEVADLCAGGRRK